MKRKRWMFLAALLVLVVGCAKQTTVEKPSTPTPEKTTAPSPSAVPAGVTILADGVVQTVQPALPLAFETGGKLLVVHVQAGDLVKAGDLIATLDDRTLQEAITDASLQVDQAKNGLAQAQLALDDLLDWEADETAVALAEANLTTAETAFENAEAQDASAGNSLTSARIGIEQAERSLADAQRRYEAGEPW